ncbi:uncharacterized protein LOC122004654 [Zingiber officinale]|uniref:uncharacterized protein LOC122004654 n=1 Tax=Zingiber officinale TaxID=94328 RepID=UPI001C4C41FA|nr:uncharacterized protein LOC122004654 [Zingiber officinale]
MWSSVIEVLGNVHDDASYSANKGVAAGLIEKMESYQFVFVLHLMKYILGITTELSLSLQQGDQNIVQAMSLVRSVKCRLQDFREDGWQIILEQVNTFCELNMIPILDMEGNMLTRGHGRRRGQLITNFHHYRVEIFCQKLVGTEKHLVFPLVYRMIELALVLPVATASVERVFSAMKTVKTDLRNKMGDEWMNDSLVIYIEKDIFSTIENEQILQHFQRMQSRYGLMEIRSSIKWDKGKALRF